MHGRESGDADGTRDDGARVAGDLVAEIRDIARRDARNIPDQMTFGAWLGGITVRRIRDHAGLRACRRKIAVRFVNDAHVRTDHLMIRPVFQARESEIRAALDDFPGKPILGEIPSMRFRYGFAIDSTASWLGIPTRIVERLESEAVRVLVHHFADGEVRDTDTMEWSVGDHREDELSDQLVIDVLTNSPLSAHEAVDVPLTPDDVERLGGIPVTDLVEMQRQVDIRGEGVGIRFPKANRRIGVDVGTGLSGLADDRSGDTITMLDVLLGADPSNLGLVEIVEPTLPKRPFPPA
ncbi:hypothetical protein AB0H00_14280 [Nocardia sp. NPDC023852]|uniref:hypothetical protein n=1 Tax=Nocardia sp. NPDC023852 TaxID=3154697 RepID=UPI0033CF7803